ncbi:hypothetical protein DOY81_014654 [Sarcophaga bullata]|nr:hypothetical protein DOY81_014654 [Sarcophaga bullata]
MFNGSWKESCQDFVHIKILDDRITLDEIDPKGVISVLATATLFHLDGIIDKCAEVMVETINAETAINYYEAACQYGCQNVKKSTFMWLEINLLCIYTKYPNLLRQISIELMTALISSPQICMVMQTEFSLYTLLRTWIYLQCNTPSGNGDVIQQYFTSRKEKRSFLSTLEGQQYLKPFLALRTQYLTNHHMDLKIVLNDNIIPKEWLHHHVLTHWNSILKVDHLPEEGFDYIFKFIVLSCCCFGFN